MFSTVAAMLCFVIQALYVAPIRAMRDALKDL
jgi:hypothetical protein